MLNSNTMSGAVGLALLFPRSYNKQIRFKLTQWPHLFTCICLYFQRSYACYYLETKKVCSDYSVASCILMEFLFKLLKVAKIAYGKFAGELIVHSPSLLDIKHLIFFEFLVYIQMHKVLIPYYMALAITPPTHSLEGTLLVRMLSLCIFTSFLAPFIVNQRSLQVTVRFVLVLWFNSSVIQTVSGVWRLSS